MNARVPAASVEALPTAGDPDGGGEAGYLVRGSSAYRRGSLALFLAGFATFSLVYCVQPLLPGFAKEFQVSPADSALAMSVTTASLAVAILCAGALSESAGRRGLMFASMCAAALANTVVAFTPSWHGLLVARAIEGAALGGVPAVAMAYLAEEVDPKGLGSAMGLYVGGTALGAMLGRLGVGAMSELTTWRIAMASMGGLGLLAAIGFVLLLPPSRHFVRTPGFSLSHHRDAWLGHLRGGRLPLLFLIGFLSLGVFVSAFNFIGFRLSEAPYGLNHMEISLIFGVYVLGVVASSTAGAMSDRFGRAPILVAGFAISFVGLALTLAAPLAVIIGGVICVTVGFFVAHSTASGWVGRAAEGSKGHAASLYLLAYYLGSSVAGWAGGWFYGVGGWTAVVAFDTALLVLALVAALRLGASERPRPAFEGDLAPGALGR
ncbi:MFS transporter [Hansschlegelia sp. KR7-227]|uniref:MFS transporter n=1 Tax=Hansschlegelia sp. KR7-227 TaxID=3400914 RepID=UPI003C0EE603